MPLRFYQLSYKKGLFARKPLRNSFCGIHGFRHTLLKICKQPEGKQTNRKALIFGQPLQFAQSWCLRFFAIGRNMDSINTKSRKQGTNYHSGLPPGSDRTHDAYRFAAACGQPDTVSALRKKRGTYHRSRNTAQRAPAGPGLRMQMEHILTETRNQLCFWQPGQHPQDEMRWPLKSERIYTTSTCAGSRFAGINPADRYLFVYYNDEIVPVSRRSRPGMSLSVPFRRCL